MRQESKSLVAEEGRLEGAELSFCLPFDTYFEVLASGKFARKHRVTIWLLGKNSYVRFKQDEKGLFGREVFLTVAEGNEGFSGFPVNVRIENCDHREGEEWKASKMRLDSQGDLNEDFMVVQSIDYGKKSDSWRDCEIRFKVVK